MSQHGGGIVKRGALAGLSLTGLCLAGLLALACSRADEKAAPAAAPAAAPEAAAATPTEGEAAPAPVSAAAPYAGENYVCPDGVKFNARLDKGNMALTLDGKTVTLAPTEGSYAANYSGEGVSLVAQGDHALLTRDGKATEDCKTE